MKVGEFIGTLFLARDITHRVHLSTRSYAKHMALGSFYEEIIPLADSFAEAYQGKHGLIKEIPLLSNSKETNIAQFLESQASAIEEGRYKICDERESPLQNIIDEILGLYLATIYKLKFLS